jgi:hypothetical protein
MSVCLWSLIRPAVAASEEPSTSSEGVRSLCLPFGVGARRRVCPVLNDRRDRAKLVNKA